MKYRFCTLDWLLRPVMFFYQSHLLTFTFLSGHSIHKYVPYCCLNDQMVSFQLTRSQASQYAVK